MGGDGKIYLIWKKWCVFTELKSGVNVQSQAMSQRIHEPKMWEKEEGMINILVLNLFLLVQEFITNSAKCVEQLGLK